MPQITLEGEALAAVEQSFLQTAPGSEPGGAPCEHCLKSKEFRTVLSKPIDPPKPQKQQKPRVQEPIIAEGNPKIAIIIDDMGMDRKRSAMLVQMPQTLTLAYLPYAPDLAKQTAEAKSRGHELMIHMPMQAMDSSLGLGAIALREGMSADQIQAELDKAFSSFSGYVGMNNHMGSQVTQNESVMAAVMDRLAQKNLYFVDSVTTQRSVAYETALVYGLRAARRDIFLDHENSPGAIASALRDLEELANRKGYAIAIGHPRDHTIEALKRWMPLAQEKGFEFVHASALLSKAEKPNAIPQSQSQPPEE
jgi:polysaccharide deacetylase 2 family uncharacterized protein YibQ